MKKLKQNRNFETKLHLTEDDIRELMSDLGVSREKILEYTIQIGIGNIQYEGGDYYEVDYPDGMTIVVEGRNLIPVK